MLRTRSVVSLAVNAGPNNARTGPGKTVSTMNTGTAPANDRRHCRRNSVRSSVRRPALWSSQKCGAATRSDEHTSELQSLMHNSYAVFCLKKTKYTIDRTTIKHRYKQVKES